ncbi:MAG: MBL fold metallo-hydrolase [Waddliaceae bacterium]
MTHLPRFCPLASGSKGNSIYLETEHAKILIDAGISTRAIGLRLAEIGVNLADIDAILVTHDHTDHIQGLRVAAFRMGIPVFANNETAKGIVNTFGKCPKFKIFSTGETFSFADLEIHPFSIMHDTLDPVAFTIQFDGKKIGICADLGFATSLVHKQLENCDYLYLEANHCPELVKSCPRPMVYKQRVLSRQGHLSNMQCAELLREIAHPGLKHVHLAHLSSECNHPDKAKDEITSTLSKAGIELNLSIAWQDRISQQISL